MLNFFGSFGKVGQWFTGLLVLTGLFLGLRWLWFRPELWNGPAKGYFTHVSLLQTDSVQGSLARMVLESALLTKDSLITRLSTEMQTALSFGQQWKDRYAKQVTVSDHATDQLTDKQRELTYYQALLANGTLSPTPTPLPLSAPEVVNAGLKTANREVLARSVNDSLSTTLGYYQAANERLGKGLATATSGLTGISRTAGMHRRGGIWPFNAKRRKQARRIQQQADSLTRAVDAVSDIEKELNKKL